MPKNIIFCADGTWNHPQESTPGAKDTKFNTNVAKLTDEGGAPGAFANTGDTQIVIYDDGVGVEFPEFLGGAFGVGLFGKIKQGYAGILSEGRYQEGDRIFLFGFSRGAYTARSLAGLLSLIGLPTVLPAGDPAQMAKEAAERAFGAYSVPLLRKELLNNMAAYQLKPPIVAMQGMWDTVGSLGFTGALFGAKDPIFYGFLDTKLYANTLAAYHAMAIDEHRGQFVMTPWTDKAKDAEGHPIDSQVLEEVWFAGVHSDVGGSATQLGTGVHGVPAVPSALADITLGWMLENAEKSGAILAPAADQYRHVDPMKAIVPQKDSFSPLWIISRHRKIPAGATMAGSVVTRLRWDGTYRPTNVSLTPDGQLAPSYAVQPVTAPAPEPDGVVIPSDAVQFDTGIDLVAGQTYRFTAHGTWVDLDYPAGPDGDPHPGAVRAALNLTRRLDSALWMALLGRIDHGDWFLIGSASELTPQTGGRLFCCANDAVVSLHLHLDAYGNNQGSVVLKIVQGPAQE